MHCQKGLCQLEIDELVILISRAGDVLVSPQNMTCVVILTVASDFREIL